MPAGGPGWVEPENLQGRQWETTMNTTATFSADAVPEVPTAPLDNCHPPPAVCLPNTKNSPPTTSLEDSKFLRHDSPLGIDFAEGI